MGVRSTLVFLACLLLMSFTGCAGFGNKVAPTRPGFSAALPVKSTGSPMVSQEIEIGPYKTSAFGPYSILKLAKKKVKPSIQQVSFANDQIQYEYEIATPSGSPVTVQVGSQQTDKTTRVLGVWDAPAIGAVTGVITRGSENLGYFKQQSVGGDLFHPPAAKPGQDLQIGEIITPSGNIRHLRHVEVPKDRGTLGKFLLGAGPVCSVYQANGTTVARRDSEGVWFATNLPADQRACIVAEMALQIVQENHRDVLQSPNGFKVLHAGHVAGHLTRSAGEALVGKLGD